MFKNFSYSILIKIFSMGLAFITSIFLANIMGVEKWGEFSFILSIIFILAIPTTMGLPQLILRYIKRYNLENNYMLMKGLIYYSKNIILFFSIVFFVVFYLIYFIGLGRENITSFYFFIMFFIVLFIGQHIINKNILVGLDNPLLGQIPEMLLFPVIYLLLIISAYFANDSLNVSTVLIIMLISYFIIFIIENYLLKKYKPYNKDTPKKFLIKEWFITSIPFLLLAGSFVLLNNIDLIMIGNMIDMENVGIYKATVRVAEIVIFSISAVTIIIQPKIVQLFKKNDHTNLQKTIAKSTIVIFVTSLSFSIFILLFSKEILGLFGEDFIKGKDALLILVLIQLINAFFGQMGVLLNMTGNERYSLYAVILAMLLNTILNYFLIPQYGINGAAIASAFSILTWNMYLFIVVIRKLKINTTIFSIKALL